MPQDSQRKLSERVKHAVAVPLVDGLLRTLAATHRRRVFGARTFHERRQAGEDVCGIYVNWHEMILDGLAAMRRHRITVIISTHRDGEFIARVVRRQGVGLARGSSTRGGVRGMRELLRAARDPTIDLAFTVDGPRGPRREIKPGVLVAAQMTGRPIVPVMSASTPAWRFDSWDRFVVSKPFARVAVTVGEEVVIPREAEREDLMAVYAPRVLEAMDRAEQRSLRELGLQRDV